MDADEKVLTKDIIGGLPFFFSNRFFLVFSAASALLLAAYLSFSASLYLLLAFDGALLLVALVDFLLPPYTRTIQVARPLRYPLVMDRPNDISVEINNRTGRTISMIIQDDTPPWTEAVGLPIRSPALHPGLRTAGYRLTPPERGDHSFGNIHFWIQGALGLVWKRGEAAAAATARVYPGLAAIERRKLGVWRPAAGEAQRAFWKRGVGTEFESLRDYVPGDDTRQIHWSTTARKGKPIVRQNRVERSQNVFLVIDAGRMMTARVKGKTKMDYGLTAALLTAYAALEVGDRVGAMVVARDVLCFQPLAGGQGQFGRILDATYALEPRMEEPRFHIALSMLAGRLKRRSLVIVFTDLIDERASEGLLRYTLGLRPRHLPLVVAMSDTEVTSLADSIPRTAQDFYRKGVAAGILERRERLLAQLTSAGAMVMDVPPDKLSVSVLDRYLEIKTRSLL